MINDKMFRANKTNGEQIHGNYLQIPDSYGGVAHCLYVVTKHSTFSSASTHAIDVNSLGMATGMKDVNGVEIYGSVMVNGVLSRGGDVLRHFNNDLESFNIYMKDAAFGYDVDGCFIPYANVYHRIFQFLINWFKIYYCSHDFLLLNICFFYFFTL